MKVFLDASALVPWVSPTDQWRPRLLAITSLLRAGAQAEFMTSNWTFYEALAITNRGGRRSVERLREFVNAELNLTRVSDRIETEALRRFFDWTDKTASVVDHANLLVALDLGCEAILTFDDDFLPIARGTGIRVLG